MNTFDCIATALAGVTGNKMRAILTMFGIIIGISSVIMITSIGQGVQNTIDDQFEELGMDRIQLYAYSEEEMIESEDLLRNDDVEMLRDYDEVSAVAPIYGGFGGVEATLLNPNKTRSVNLTGIDQDYFLINTMELLHGRFIAPQDVENQSYCAMIDEGFAMDLFGKTNCLGEKLKLDTYNGSERFTIIGVIKNEDASSLNSMYERPATAYIPLSTAQAINGAEDMVNYILIKAADKEKVQQTAANIVRLMEIKHGNKDKYEAFSFASYMDQFTTVITVFTLFLSFVASISLLVGGIGVMNIMLVSVTERTREIGIRKSLGATGGNVRLQFLIEALVLTGVGGALGILFGYLGGLGIGAVAGMAMGIDIAPYISSGTVALVVGISAFIGIVFGVYPAAKAARLDPVEALRFE